MAALTIKFTPISNASFRWGGEFSPMLRGPMAYSISEPLPLPSTIAGSIVSLATEAGILSEEDLLNATDITELLEKIFGNDVVLRGPFLHVDCSDKQLLCLHKYPQNILCTDIKDKYIKYIVHNISDSYSVNIGIGIDDKLKSVKRGLMYTQQCIDYNSMCARLCGDIESCRDASIVVEVIGIEQQKTSKLRDLDKKFIPLGGEAKIFRVSLSSDNVIMKYMNIVSGMLVEMEEIGLYAVSPIILEPDIGDPLELVLDYKRVFANNAFKPISTYNPDISLRYIRKTSPSKDKEPLGIRLSLLGLGYDMKKNKPRPFYPAIMPGSVITLKPKEPPDHKTLYNIYTHGLGLYTQVGWGTVLPIVFPKTSSQ